MFDLEIRQIDLEQHLKRMFNRHVKLLFLTNYYETNFDTYQVESMYSRIEYRTLSERYRADLVLVDRLDRAMCPRDIDANMAHNPSSRNCCIFEPESGISF